jgi:NAD(P)H-hydrate repair Nnr-like enzyme with NAD(P)H-hydrate epimerase domain
MKEKQDWKHTPVSDMSYEEMAKIIDAFFGTSIEKDIKEIEKNKIKNESY